MAGEGEKPKEEENKPKEEEKKPEDPETKPKEEEKKSKEEEKKSEMTTEEKEAALMKKMTITVIYSHPILLSVSHPFFSLQSPAGANVEEEKILSSIEIHLTSLKSDETKMDALIAKVTPVSNSPSSLSSLFVITVVVFPLLCDTDPSTHKTFPFAAVGVKD